jgi:hypothetical protein
VSSCVADVMFLCVKCNVVVMLFHFACFCVADVLFYFVNSRIVASLLDTTRCFISCSTPRAAVTLYVALGGFFRSEV